MSYRIAIDTGGTFTDAVVTDREGQTRVGKAATTADRVFVGVEAALGQVAESWGIDLRTLLQRTDLFVYATTHSLNAIVQRRTARTAALVTEGFPDLLVLREGGRANAFDFSTPYPEPYVPRSLTYEIVERIDAEGGVVTPLDEDAARRTLRAAREDGVEAVAVSLLWSFVNPAHEEALGRLIEEELPGVPYTLSHRLTPIIREYRRASSAAIDASLKPLMQRHITEMEQDLREAGFAGELLVGTSAGGVMHTADVIERPIYTVRAGPAMAPVAGKVYAEAEGQSADVIVCDTGGTSFDVSLVRAGELKFTRETWLGPPFTGDLVGISSVDVRSIGAGGGSIAWIDPGGMLRVGPQSAGADPGPACYGRGGTEPTVTDAATVLGYVDPDYFLGGRMALDRQAARAAIARIAEPLEMSLVEAAQAIVAVAGEGMVEAIKDITVKEGVDPRSSVLVAGGGAAGLNIIPIARALGCRRVILPSTAGALSACGVQLSDVTAEYTATAVTSSVEFDYAFVNGTLERLDDRMNRFGERLAARGLERSQREYFVEARYAYQVWELDVPLRASRFRSEQDVAELVDDFHEVHERIFAVREPGQTVECVGWKARLTAHLDRPPLVRAPFSEHEPDPVALRSMYFAELGEVDAAVHRGEELRSGATIAGPSVIEEETTTIVLYPGSRVSVTALGSYLIELDVDQLAVREAA